MRIISFLFTKADSKTDIEVLATMEEILEESNNVLTPGGKKIIEGLCQFLRYYVEIESPGFNYDIEIDESEDMKKDHQIDMESLKEKEQLLEWD